MEEYKSDFTGAEIDAAVKLVLSNYIKTFNGRIGPTISPEFGDYVASLVSTEALQPQEIVDVSGQDLLTVLTKIATHLETIEKHLISYPLYALLRCDNLVITPAVNTKIPYSFVLASSGLDYSLTDYSITLKAGYTYLLYSLVRLGAYSSYVYFQFYDNVSKKYFGGGGCCEHGTPVWDGMAPAMAIFSPTKDTDVFVAITLSGSTATAQYSDNSKFLVVQLKIF